eukprot:gene8698-8879_t
MQTLLQPLQPLGCCKPFGRSKFVPVCRVSTKPVSTKGKTVVGKTAKGKTQSGTVRTVRGQQQSTGTAQPEQQKRRGSRFYFNITGFPFPLGPFFERQTVRREVVKGQIWTFEQTQAFFFDVFTPVRMTVIKLKSGGLWVHAPVAPTQECLNLLRELDAPVEYIVLPTFAYEHKVFVGPFSRKFPQAKWSFPLNLPPQFFGIFPAGELLDGDTSTPWADEIEQKLLLPPPIGVSSAVRLTEASFFHKPSRSLLVTDAVVYVDQDPPACIPDKALRSQAQDGWLQRYLAGGRSAAEVAAVARRGRVEDSLEQEEILPPSSQEWSFQRIIPCHFSAPIKAGCISLAVRRINLGCITVCYVVVLPASDRGNAYGGHSPLVSLPVDPGQFGRQLWLL